MSRWVQLSYFLIAGFFVAGCGKVPDNSADIVFMNAAAYTMDADMPWAEAVAIKDDKIIYVGDNNGVSDLTSEDTRQYDLSGKMLLPGFIDAHMHVLDSGGFARALALNTEGTIEEWIQAIGDFAQANPNAPVVFGYGFLASAFGPVGPTRQLIDAVVPDRPVMILDEGMHGAWLNTRALEELNITQDTPDPVPGFSYYKRDADGNATGYLLEEFTTKPAQDGLSVFDESGVADGVASTLEIMNAYGITAAFDAGAYFFAHLIHPVLQRLEADGKMTVRVVGSFMLTEVEDIDDAIGLTKEYAATIRGDNYHFRMLKILDDGTVEGRTAAMFEDYQDEPGNSGGTFFTEEQMTGVVVDAAGENIDVHIHALGERTVHEALNAVEAARKAHPDSTSRYTLCHIQVITDQDLPRFAELDVIAQSTPLWASYDEHGRQFVSEDQFRRFWRFNSLKKLGVRLTWGSDFPASGAGTLGLSPMMQIEIGHTRQYPGEPDSPIQPMESERLGIDTLIRGYTIDAAYQLHSEDEIGSLEVGKKADLVVLDRNLFETNAYEIHKTEVVMTLMDGNIVYQKDQER